MTTYSEAILDSGKCDWVEADIFLDLLKQKLACPEADSIPQADLCLLGYIAQRLDLAHMAKERIGQGCQLNPQRRASLQSLCRSAIRNVIRVHSTSWPLVFSEIEKDWETWL